jgi:hypothetical protein
MIDRRRLLLAAATLLLLSAESALAQNIIRDVDDEEFEVKTAFLPYAFYNENFGFAVGGAAILSGWPQEQMSSVSSAIISSNETRAFYSLGRDYNPFGRLFVNHDVSFGRFGELFLEIDWWQLVPFVEVGRVAEKWSVSELHTDMKWDVGLGVRVMLKRLIGRIDIAVGDEGAGVQMMVGHPF